MKLLSGCMFFIIAMSSQSFADDIPAEEKFNEKTGELYWDLGSNIRIEYVPQCKLSRPGNYYLDSSGFRRFMKDLGRR